MGWVADFCPICRTLRAHEVLRIGAAGHIYFIAPGKGKLLGHEAICGGCDLPREINIEFYETVSKDRNASLEELEAETFPAWRETWATHLQRKRKLESGTLSPDERCDLIEEAFLLLGYSLERQETVRPLSPTGRKVAIVMIACFFLLIAASILIDGFLFDSYGDLSLLPLVPLGVLFLATLYFLGTRDLWYTRHRLRPQLARSLRPLQPTLEELEEALAEMKDHGLRIGKKLKARKIMGWFDPRDDEMMEL